jgi:DNA-binding NarL/FixJ family response regulator
MHRDAHDAHARSRHAPARRARRRGHANAAIAAALHLSVATVKARVSRLLDKLEVDNRVQIALLVQAADRH